MLWGASTPHAIGLFKLVGTNVETFGTGVVNSEEPAVSSRGSVCRILIPVRPVPAGISVRLSYRGTLKARFSWRFKSLILLETVKDLFKFCPVQTSAFELAARAPLMYHLIHFVCFLDDNILNLAAECELVAE